jgi:hypothetical protein
MARCIGTIEKVREMGVIEGAKEAVMKWTLIVSTIVLLGTFNTQAADEKARERQAVRERREQQNDTAATRADIDRRINTVNRLDNKESAKLAGYQAVSKETAVPLPQIQSEHQQHPKLGIAGLFVAHEIATHTQKPVDNLIKQRESGKTWNQIAAANGMDLAQIDTKLGRIEDAMKAAK